MARLNVNKVEQKDRLICVEKSWLDDERGEAMFLGGLDKGAFLRAFEPDFYFDDQRRHVDSARLHVAAGHVPFGVANIR